MESGYAIVASPRGDGFVELAAATAPPKAQGRVFRKQILKYGDLRYPTAAGGKVKIDEAFADALVRNFSEVGEIVHAPKADARNRHTDDPDRNTGEVIGVVKTDKGVDILLDARTDDADKLGKTLLGMSALLDLNHENRETGEKVGPTLLHTCITNRPYVTGLEGFQEVLLSAPGGADITSETVVLTDDDQEVTMTKEEWLAQGAEFGVDVAALTDRAELAVALSAKIKETFGASDILELSAGSEPTAEELIDSVSEAGERIVKLTADIDTIRETAAKDAATARVEKLALTGYILPKEKAARTRLLLKDPDLFEEMLPSKPIVALSVEAGREPIDQSFEQIADAEVERYVKLSQEMSAAAPSA